MNEVGKFMEALQNDPRAKELMESISVPVDAEKSVDVYVDLAKKLGFTISREDLLNWQQEKDKEYKAKSEKAEAGMAEGLDQDQMKMVAGGGIRPCRDTYKSGEWCWYTDSCAMIAVHYD